MKKLTLTLILVLTTLVVGVNAETTIINEIPFVIDANASADTFLVTEKLSLNEAGDGIICQKQGVVILGVDTATSQIIGNGRDRGIMIMADDVIVKQVTFTNFYNGILAFNCKNTRIENNAIFNNQNSGLLVTFADDNSIVGNDTYNNNGNGIMLISSDNNLVDLNKTTGEKNQVHGICLGNDPNEGNLCQGNTGTNHVGGQVSDYQEYNVVSGTNSVVSVFVPTTTTNLHKPDQSTPTHFTLNQNYPNPFNPTTTISYQLPQSGYVNLTVYNLQGQTVAELVNNEHQTAGIYEVQFDGSHLPSGKYFYKITVDQHTQVKTATLIK